MSNSGFSDNDTDENVGCGDNVVLVEAISKRCVFYIHSFK